MQERGLRGGHSAEGIEGIECGDWARGDDSVERVLSVSGRTGTGSGVAGERSNQDSAPDAEQLLAVCSSNVGRFAQDISGELQILSLQLRYQDHSYNAILKFQVSTWKPFFFFFFDNFSWILFPKDGEICKSKEIFGFRWIRKKELIGIQLTNLSSSFLGVILYRHGSWLLRLQIYNQNDLQNDILVRITHTIYLHNLICKIWIY